MRWTALGLVLLVLCAPGRAEPEPTAEEVRAAFRGMDREERKAYLAGFSEEHLELLLEAFIETEGWSYGQRVLSNALSYRIIDRRAADLDPLAPADEALAEAPRFGVLDYPRTDGSTSTIPLERLIACRLLRSPYVWGGPEALRTLDDPFVGPARGAPIAARPPKRTLTERAARGGILADVTAPGNERLAKIVNSLLVRHTGTHGAWVNLIEGTADLVFVARAPSADETTLAAEKGIELEVKALARDAFVFLVNRVSPIESLTLGQVRKIYAGEITTWDQVGGPAEKIEAFQRNPNSGSQELFLARVMKDLPLARRGRDMIGNSMIGPFNAVASRRYALGFTVWYYERYMAALPDVRAIALDGIPPTPETVADGTYPIVTTVYAAVRADAPADGAARRLRDWLLTETGQAVVAESGYVPIR